MDHDLSSLVQNGDWFDAQDMTPYEGEWVVIVACRIVAHGPDLARVLDEAQPHIGDHVPFIASVPDGYLA